MKRRLWLLLALPLLFLSGCAGEGALSPSTQTINSRVGGGDGAGIEGSLPTYVAEYNCDGAAVNVVINRSFFGGTYFAQTAVTDRNRKESARIEVTRAEAAGTLEFSGVGFSLQISERNSARLRLDRNAGPTEEFDLTCKKLVR